ncbi:hypothetical protein [Streptomyces sp. NBC_01431]|uniref:hypothetical protein n=1 Tax=Streptomyces sp. NBC_01431 TaxID=2903863 RepID=UPI002E35669A|nr:hypothetical protein [Streptomyces sp. NBC_01431]
MTCVHASVLPEITRQAAEAAAGLVPQSPVVQADDGACRSPASGPENDQGRPPRRENAQVTDVRRQGLEPRTR